MTRAARRRAKQAALKALRAASGAGRANRKHPAPKGRVHPHHEARKSTRRLRRERSTA